MGSEMCIRDRCGTLLYLYRQRDIRTDGCGDEFYSDPPVSIYAFYIAMGSQIVFIYGFQCPGIGYFILCQNLRFVYMPQGNVRKSGPFHYGSVKD